MAKGVSFTIFNGTKEDAQRVQDALQDSSFGTEYAAVITSIPVDFATVEDMVQVLEIVLEKLKTALPDKGQTPKENPFSSRE